MLCVSNWDAVPRSAVAFSNERVSSSNLGKCDIDLSIACIDVVRKKIVAGKEWGTPAASMSVSLDWGPHQQKTPKIAHRRPALLIEAVAFEHLLEQLISHEEPSCDRRQTDSLSHAIRVPRHNV